MKTSWLPSNYPQFSAAIAARDAAAAIAFYLKIFGAKERIRLVERSGKVGHAELEFPGGGVLMIADRYEGCNETPDDLGGKTTVTLHLYVEDVDAAVQRAVDAGAKLLGAPTDQFYGDRNGRIMDPFGHVWALSTHIEDVSVEEMKRRFDGFQSEARE